MAQKSSRTLQMMDMNMPRALVIPRAETDIAKPPSRPPSWRGRNPKRLAKREVKLSIRNEYENRSIVWECWNGGADQRGPLLKLNKDKTFEYSPHQTINRVVSIKGSWLVENNKIVLSVESENVLFGGYVTEDASHIKNGSPVIIQYKTPLKITLPLNESQAPEKYNLNWSEKWLMIGYGDWYISKDN